MQIQQSLEENIETNQGPELMKSALMVLEINDMVDLLEEKVCSPLCVATTSLKKKNRKHRRKDARKVHLVFKQASPVSSNKCSDQETLDSSRTCS